MPKKPTKPVAESAAKSAPKAAKTSADKATAKPAVKSGEKATKATKSAKPTIAKKSAIATPPARTSAAKPGSKPGTPVTIVVRHDAGWGNHLHLRGEGPGLSWDCGAPLCCVHDSEWVWVAPASGPVTFKVLHNDSRWASGENITVNSGETLTLRPVF